MFDGDEDNFILKFTHFCENTEAPEDFVLWTAIAGVSCVLGRRVWLNAGAFTVYPNLYVCLVGPSGSRKSTSIELFERILYTVEPGPKLISQKITPEALIDALRITPPNNDPGVINLEPRCEGFVMVDELQTFLNRNAYEAGLGPLLVPFYDCKRKWAYRTKGGGEIPVNNACLGILGASTAEWISDAIPERAIAGGLTARFVFVFSELSQKMIAWPTVDLELMEELRKALLRLSTLNQEIGITKEGKEWFTQWYPHFRTKDGIKLLTNPNLEKYANRRPFTMLKVALNLAASRWSEKVDVIDLQAANGILLKAEQDMPKVLNLISSTSSGLMLQHIHDFIIKGNENGRGGCMRSTILQHFGNRISSDELAVIIKTLRDAGAIEEVMVGIDICYKLK